MADDGATRRGGTVQSSAVPGTSEVAPSSDDDDLGAGGQRRHGQDVDGCTELCVSAELRFASSMNALIAEG